MVLMMAKNEGPLRSQLALLVECPIFVLLFITINEFLTPSNNIARHPCQRILFERRHDTSPSFSYSEKTNMYRKIYF